MESQVNPVICHPVLRKVVGPDPLGAVAGPDLALARGRPLLILRGDAAARHHDDRSLGRAVVEPANLVQDLEAVVPRQQDVQQDQAGHVLGENPQGLAPVEEPDEIAAALRYAAALGPAFAVGRETGASGVLSIVATDPDLSLVVEIGDRADVRWGTGPNFRRC